MEAIILNELVKAYGPPVAALGAIAYALWQRRNANPPPPEETYATIQYIRDTVIRIEVHVADIKARQRKDDL